MHTILVRVTEVDDKKFLKELSPIFIWVVASLACLFLLPAGTLSGLIMIITFLAIVPIAIICYKRTAPFRHQVYRSTILTFDVINGNVFMNGQEVRITMNQESQFIIYKSVFSSYAVEKRATKEFSEFLETNDIPYIRLTGKKMKRRAIVISKKQIVMALAYVLVIIVVANIAKAIYPVLSIPIGVLLGAVILGSIFGLSEYVVVKGVIEEKKIKDKLIATVMSLVFIIPLLYAVGRGIDSVQDIIAGPQESIVYDIDVKKVHGSRVGDSYYFIGKVQEDEVKKLTMWEEQYDYCLELIDTTIEENRADTKYRIYYFENINSLYDIEVYE